MLSLLLLASCTHTTPVPHAPRGLTPTHWGAQLQPRLEDARYGFTTDGLGFRGHRAPVQFDLAGAHLGAITVRTARWGRASALRPATLGAPRLGACVPGRTDPTGACVRRLEYPGAGLEEWWVGAAAGMEQGWTVARPPPGAGP